MESKGQLHSYGRENQFLNGSYGEWGGRQKYPLSLPRGSGTTNATSSIAISPPIEVTFKSRVWLPGANRVKSTDTGKLPASMQNPQQKSRTDIQWNLWITDTAGPRCSVHNREVSFIRRVHPVMWRPFPVAVCHVFNSLALLCVLEFREALKCKRMDRNSWSPNIFQLVLYQ